MSLNIYLPVKALIRERIDLSRDVVLLKVRPERAFHFHPGQFFMLSLWGSGEVPISVASLPQNEDGLMEFCIRRVGRVTSSLHTLREGDILWMRGPYGRGFPLEWRSNSEELEGETVNSPPTGTSPPTEVIIVAGGVGLAPLRPVIQWLSRGERPVKRIILLYGARTPQDILFTKDINDWIKSGVEVHLTVDEDNRDMPEGTETYLKEGVIGGEVTVRVEIGLVTSLLKKVQMDFGNAMAFVCGPPVMIKIALEELYHLGIPSERIITSLEAHMKCGVGKCGHCYSRDKYICIDGPVFNYREIKELCLIV